MGSQRKIVKLCFYIKRKQKPKDRKFLLDPERGEAVSGTIRHCSAP